MLRQHRGPYRGEIAESAEFFSFGTNDLTQTCFGFSRDDAEGKFLPAYIHQHILKDNPFAVLDREGVGRLMRIAVEEGRKTRPRPRRLWRSPRNSAST